MDVHPVPRADDLIDRIGTAKHLSTFDLKSGYWHIELTPGAKFALMQYSSTFTLHFDFNTFRNSWNTDSLMKNISQHRGQTYTPTAIQKVVQEVFTVGKGTRSKVAKILIVITDGQTYGDKTSLSDVVAEAENKGIVRYAIGVGDAFRSKEAERELDTIASRPKDQHKFSPDNFDALKNIKETLQQKIFSIEGTQTTNISSFQLEMAQRGSSAAFTQSSIILGSVGAYDWSGGLFVYLPQQNHSEPTFISVSSGETKPWGSYLGYSTKVVNLQGGQVYVSGAPRFQHVGRVMIFDLSGRTMQTISGSQVGSYFGAELCTLDLNDDGITDFLLVAAPMYHSEKIGGIVHVYQCNLSMVSQ
ncbi:integrin alpha-X-like [Pleurodeles waltl]|uniref:integrin alpha-X-like n=1 Tax=Pleurodeles waltl TaxID=8319 RepID=UPI003709ACB7